MPVAPERPPHRVPDVVYIPTPHDIVEKMLQLAAVGKDDVVYDLGCGDGRIVIAAARKYGCKAIGVDIDPLRVEQSRKNVATNNVGHLVTIEQRDLRTLDLRQATVVTLYLTPGYNTRLIPQLEKMKPGSRIVSHAFAMHPIKPDRTVTVTAKESGRKHTLYLWTVPLEIGQIDLLNANPSGRMNLIARLVVSAFP